MEYISSNTQIHKYTVVTFLILLLSLTGLAQTTNLHTKNKKAISQYEDALRFYNMNYTKEAVLGASKAMELDSGFLEAYVVLGEIYLEVEQYSDAAYFLQLAKDKDQVNEIPVIGLMLGEAYINDKQLEKGMSVITDYLQLPAQSKKRTIKAERLLDLAAFRKTMFANPVPFKPVNLGASINTGFIEHSPTLTVDEQTLYFTRKHTENKNAPFMQEDLMVSTKDENGQWTKAQMLSSQVNGNSNEGASAISPDGRYLFFTSCEREGGIGSCDIYLARKEQGRWVKARNLGEVINSRSWESQPSFAPDGRTLYFVKRVGRGRESRKDIFRTQITNNGWSAPVRISINTSGNEESPFIHPDGETFYFVSDGYLGLGGRDLFMCKIDSTGEFGEPVNLGYPINSANDEASLIVSANGQRAYYASAQEGGFGQWDLYMFDLPQELKPIPVNYTKGFVYNVDSRIPVGAKFEIVDLATGDVMVESFSDKVDGTFLVTIPTGRDYGLSVSAKGYLFYSANYHLPQGDTSAISFDVPLTPIQEGAAIVLNNVFFDYNQYTLKTTSKIELNKLVALLMSNPKMHVEIGGHTDNKGGEDFNQRLSENRAKAVYDYLISKGIEQARLSYKGYNYSQPVADNATAKGRAKNRRTEFKILKLE